MSKLICFLLLFLILFSSGCWDSREVNELAYPIVIGIDKKPGEEEGKIERYLFTYSLPVLTREAEESRTLHTLATYDTYQSIALLQGQVSRGVTLGQIRIIAFGEDVAREGLTRQLPFFERSVQVRGDTFLVISDGQSAKELLNHQVSEIEVGVYIPILLEHSARYNFIPPISVNSFIIDTDNIARNTIVPTISISGQQMYLSGLAVIKKGKMVGKLSRNEGMMLSLLRNQGVSGVISKPNFAGTNQPVSAQVEGKTKITPFYKAGKFSFLLEIILEGELTDDPRGKDIVGNPAEISKIERDLAAQVKSNLERVVKKLQEDMKTDALYVGEAAYIKYPRQFNLEKWEKEFPEAEIKIKVKLKIRRIGVAT